MQPKYIFMMGGVCSGLGKGITAASLGRLLKARGYKVTIQKFDPYINMNPGFLNPCQHGEVYVTEDGAEVDLDLGHYERFIDENLSASNSVSAGKIYWDVLTKERMGHYKGETIQIIPHITDSIKRYVRQASRDAQSDIIISEIGGTVGDIESLPFLEAIRQIAHDVGHENVMYIHVTLIPYLSFADEMKTKPSQHSVKQLLSLGIKPDALVCRTERPISKDMREKLALFCNVDKSCVIENIDADSLYDVPLLLENEGFADIVCKRLKLKPPAPDLTEWTSIVGAVRTTDKQVNIGLVGKYTELRDAYLSVHESLVHAGIALGAKINLSWIHSKDMTDDNAGDKLAGLDGIIAPGGYGDRDLAGIISTARYARENKVPFFGIGLGMQCAVIDFARNVAGIKDANTVEIDNDAAVKVVEFISVPIDETMKLPMRRGAFLCKLNPDSLLYKAYGEALISERFRHLCKINNQYRKELVAHGLVEAAASPDDQHMEAIELPQDVHPWFVGVQFRPEFKSRITRPSPIFRAFVEACL
ncbi:MAG: CTP synthase [Defluviitaleaceae bacterium]|nr:CTP synthase [Defluviitaleaceae bacterium]